jgi:hypothetical protein
MEWLTEEETINFFLDLFYDPSLPEDEDIKCLDTSSKDDVIKFAKKNYQANQDLKKYMQGKRILVKLTYY